MNETLKNLESKEGQEKVKILLHFFRRGEKEKADKSDTEIRLTEAGALQAASKANEDTDYTKAKVIGSPRQRTQQTGALVAYGAQEGVLGTESLEEINAKLNEDFENQNIRVSDKLDFLLPQKG